VVDQSPPRPIAESVGGIGAARSSLRPLSAVVAGALAALAIGVFYFAGLGAAPLFEPDEGRYAEVPREMLASGDLLTPRLDEALYFEKPPLYYWLNAAALATVAPLTSLETAVRLWGALFAVAGLALAYALGRAMEGRRAGLSAAVVLATSPLYYAFARTASIDMTESVLLTAALACFWFAHRRPRDGGGRPLWYGMFAAAALAVLGKGLIGVVIPAAVIGLYLLLTRQWRVLAAVPWIGGTLLFLVVAAPWHLWMAVHHPRFLWFYFVHEHLLRYATDATHRWQPFWFFVPVLLLGLLPWSGLLAAATVARPTPGAAGVERRRAFVFLACWAGFIVLFFSASHSKLVPYVLPALPPLALLVALALSEAEAGRAAGGARSAAAARWGGAAGGLLLSLLAAGMAWAALGRVPHLGVPPVPAAAAVAALAAAASLAAAALAFRRHGRAAFVATALAAAVFCAALATAAPAVAATRSTDRLAAALVARLAPGDEVAVYDTFPETLPAYLGRAVVVVDYRGELEFGVAHLPEDERVRRFPSAAEFAERWGGARTVYLVTLARALPRMRAAGLAPGPILARQGELVLMSNRMEGGPAR
jgi:4-amino-4-deoxy-L-arabinose transferase-like glycosyltransferase